MKNDIYLTLEKSDLENSEELEFGDDRDMLRHMLKHALMSIESLD